MVNCESIDLKEGRLTDLKNNDTDNEEEHQPQTIVTGQRQQLLDEQV